MKILAAADVHGKHSTYAWIAGQAKARAADAIVLAGDLLGWPERGKVEAWQARDAEMLVAILEQMPCPVLYVMGNDDLVELPKRTDRVASLHGRKCELGNFNFIGYQYTLPFMGGVFEKPEHQMASDLKALAPLVDERTILVTHGPAYGILDLGVLDLHAGSRSLLDLIRTRRPCLHIHGHIHQCVAREGLHLNVGTCDSRRVVLIDLESLEDEVILGD